MTKKQLEIVKDLASKTKSVAEVTNAFMVLYPNTNRTRLANTLNKIMVNEKYKRISLAKKTDAEVWKMLKHEFNTKQPGEYVEVRITKEMKAPAEIRQHYMTRNTVWREKQRGNYLRVTNVIPGMMFTATNGNGFFYFTVFDINRRSGILVI